MARAVIISAADDAPDDSSLIEILGPTFLGASLAFLAAVLIQALVIPWVQSRTRMRERWEDSVVELASLVEEQLPRAMRELLMAVDTERVFHSIKGDPNVDSDRLNERLKVAATERRRADEIVEQHLKRMRLLTTHIMRRRSGAPYWDGFKRRQRFVEIDATSISISGLVLNRTDVNYDEWKGTRETLWSEYEETANKFTKMVTDLESSMKPPPSRLMWRAWRATKSLPKRVNAWLKAFRSDEPDASDEAAS